MDLWIYGWMDGWTYIYECLDPRMIETIFVIVMAVVNDSEPTEAGWTFLLDSTRSLSAGKRYILPAERDTRLSTDLE